MTLRLNFPYFVEQVSLPASRVLDPLFEAISNSFDAIEEKGKLSDGEIQIDVERVPQINFLPGEDNSEVQPIQHIVVTDNGIGFKEENFSSFSELSSARKISKGGKGMGRVTWLRAFKWAEIQSSYYEGEELQQISFKFSNSTAPISEVLREKSAAKNSGARVKLCESQDYYRNHLPKTSKILGEEIVMHFLSFFMAGELPIIKIRDGETTIILGELFDEIIAQKSSRDRFNIGSSTFDIAHALTKFHSIRNKEHRLYLLAGGRVVESLPLTNESLSGMPDRLKLAEKDYVYSGYLESPLLDKVVNQFRNGFSLSESNSEKNLLNEPTKQEIKSGAVSSIENFLKDEIQFAREERDRSIKEYINQNEPNFAYIYKYHKERLSRIPYSAIQKGALSAELHKIHVELKAALKQEVQEVLDVPDSQLNSAYAEQIADLVDKMNEPGKAELAQYIIHRKVVLELLAKAIKADSSGSFQKEEVIHKIVFPIKTTSDDITYEQHNLWLLDEKLAYNTFIASDIPFRKIPGHSGADESGLKRPDLYVYTFATAERKSSPYHNLDLFEFKKPMRKDYSSKENPFIQIREYLEIIRKGTPEDKDGRAFSIVQGGLVYCHIICDFTDKLKEMLRGENYRQVGNEDWWYLFHDNYKALIEVKSLDYMIETATKRNKILFDKLGI